ncbi:MAG: hypothetical protein AB7S70_02480 [Hyphomicrobium sp.]|uniref:hypothetical protein n=1 Tax=Hyphomicrobium sp. TaxID=82 RepID=UPI003D14F7C0
MTDAAPDPKRAHVPILEQIEDAKATLAHRYRSCSTRVRTGQMSQADADREIARARAIRNTLIVVAQHAPAFRAVLEAKRQRRIENDEIDAIRQHPAVQHVLAAFPDADVGLPLPAATEPARADPETATEDAAA